MTPFVYTNEVVFCIIMIVYLLSAFVGAVSFAMSVSYKLKIFYVLPEVITSLVSLLFVSYLCDAIRIRYLGENPNNFIKTVCFMPLWSVTLIAVILISLGTFWLILVIKKRLSSLTAMSVKEAISILSSGLCFFDTTGRILLINKQIDDECKEITGESLNDGLTFWDNMKYGKINDSVKVTSNGETIIVEFDDGIAICYKRIMHNLDNRIVYEITGNDISYELMLKKEIEQKNLTLFKMNSRLRKYGETVTEVTREREIFSARVKVHSNLGSLILRTKKSLSEEEYDKAALISEWNDLMSLIFLPDDEEDKFNEANKTAANIGVKVCYNGKYPPKGTPTERIFANAVFECVVNTARHADGTELYVSMNENELYHSIVIENNGKCPTGEVKEGGGLSSLRIMTENVGGKMIVQSAPQFVLTIVIPKEMQRNER